MSDFLTWLRVGVEYEKLIERMRAEDGIFFRDPKQAFEGAVRSGRLSRDPSAPNYAGGFMYMGTQVASFSPARQQKDLFKNSITRDYLP